MHICHALEDGFLNPFVHLVFILIEPITAEDIATSKRWRCNCTEVFLCVRIIWSQHIPPRHFQHIVGIMRPLGAGLMKELTQVLDRSSAESPPMAGPVKFLRRPRRSIFENGGTRGRGAAITRIGESG